MTTTDMPAPIPVKVIRYRCPHCHRSHSTRARCVQHIGRCWHNPGARGCKTCANYEPAQPGEPDVGIEGTPESCTSGVDLNGHPACPACSGYGWADTDFGAEKRCGPDVTAGHIGDGQEVKPGPIVGCNLWTADTGTEEES